MWFVAAALAAEPAPETPPADPVALARTHTRRGAIALTAGTALLAGAVVEMTVGRGDPGEISTEDPTIADVRNVTGGVLGVGGVTVMLVGSAELVSAHELRHPSPPPVVIAPVPVGRGDGAGLAIAARF